MTDVFASLKPCRWCGHHPYFCREDGLVCCMNDEEINGGPICPIEGEDFTVSEWNLLTDTEFTDPTKLKNLIAAFKTDPHTRATMFEKAFQVLYCTLFPEAHNG